MTMFLMTTHDDIMNSLVCYNWLEQTPAQHCMKHGRKTHVEN